MRQPALVLSYALAAALSISGTAISAVLSSPSAVGGLYLFNVICSFGSCVVGLSLPTAARLARSEYLSGKIIESTTRIAAGGSVAITVILISILEPSFGYLVLAGPGIFLNVSLACHESGLWRANRFSSLARFAINTALTLFLLKVIFAIFITSPASLVVASFLALTISHTIYRQPTAPPVRHPSSNLLNSLKIRLAQDKLVISRHGRFARHQTLQQALNLGGTTFAVSLFAFFFGVAEAGLLGAAMAYSCLPSQLFGKLIGELFLVKLNIGGNSSWREMKLVLNRETRNLLIASIGLFVVLVALLYWLRPFLLPTQWSRTVDYAILLLAWQTTVFINFPSVKFLMAVSDFSLSTVANLATLSLRVLSICWGYASQSPIIAIETFVLIGILHNVVIVGYANWGWRPRGIDVQ